MLSAQLVVGMLKSPRLNGVVESINKRETSDPLAMLLPPYPVTLRLEPHRHAQQARMLYRLMVQQTLISAG
jgi:hypothetical protein